MWWTIKLLALAGLGYAAVAAWVYFSQHRLLYTPRKTLHGTPAEIGLAYEDVRLINRLGTALHGWWLPHASPRFTLLLSHGNGGNVSHRLETLRIFDSLGLSVLIYDYSGYGRSEGMPGEEATRADAEAAWSWLIREQGIDPGRIILFGRSLGGAVAARLARRLHEDTTVPAGLILESTFTSVPDMGAHRYPWLPVRLLARFRYDTIQALDGLALPALFLHSPEDEVIPYALGHALYDAYQGPKAFVPLTGSHNTGFIQAGQGYVDGLDRFLTGLEG